MLEPDDRYLLTDALRPPVGFHLDIAVATTYSLSLSSLILAPLAMAAHDQVSSGPDNVPDPIALLESVHRYAERTTVFCHAGAIYVPGTYQHIVAFAEDSVVQVRPTMPGRVFHPKIWVLRFINSDKQLQHRFLCLSRNLTDDKSWDTVLVMDQSPEGVGADSSPLVSFLRALPSLTLPGTPLSEDRRLQIDSLMKSLKEVRFEVPEPFQAAELWPMGTAGGRGWPLPEQASDLFVISPFFDPGFLQDMPNAPEPWLVSRPETFDRLGSDAIPEGCAPYVLQRASETEDLDEPAQPSGLEIGSGLHAKTFVWNERGQGYVFTGSANATRAAFTGNVEFSVLLSGPGSSCGTTPLLDDTRGNPSFSRLIELYQIKSTEPSDDPSYEAERIIEAFHGLIAAQAITVTMEPDGDNFMLSIAVPELDEPTGSTTTVRPLGVKGPARSLSEQLVWRRVAEQNISPFVVLETTISTKTATVTRACVVKAILIGDQALRHGAILRSLLGSEREVLRYLALLLADPGFDSLVKSLEDAVLGDDRTGYHTGFGGRDDLIVFEPLLRAAARQDGSLKRVDKLFKELRDDQGALPYLSEEFQRLWSVVWEAMKEPSS